MNGQDTARLEPGRARPPAAPPIGRIVLGVLLVLLGGAWLLDSLDAVSVPWLGMLAASLIIIGVALLATARYAPPGGLIAAGIVLSVVVLVAGLLTFPLSGRLGGAGDVSYRPERVESAEDGYALAVGSLTVDLRDIDVSAPVTIEAGVVLGEVVVLVPDGVAVEVRARTGAGEVVVEGTERSGVGVEVRQRLGPAEGSPALTLVLSAGMGTVEVRR